MRRITRLFGFLALCLALLIFALLSQPVLLLVSNRRRRRVFAFGTRIWACSLLKLIGLKVNRYGLSPEELDAHYLVVSNHQSYLDIIVVASVFPALFVAKREMRSWPILGWLARLGGTIFIDREDAHSGVSCAYQASRLLRHGISVQVFPESTTGDGDRVLAFNGLFFASAIRAQAEILPLAINFQFINGRPLDNQTRDLLYWYGEMEFVPHFWKLLQIDSAEVSVTIHQPVKASRLHKAKILAQTAQEKIGCSLGSGLTEERDMPGVQRTVTV
jgi:1-acyl-sn-glycerol-3-phosphate acyltransferase